MAEAPTRDSDSDSLLVVSSEDESEDETRPAENRGDFYEVKKIVDVARSNGVLKFRVRWKGYSSPEDTWEPEVSFDICPEILQDFWANFTGEVRDEDVEKKEKKKKKPRKPKKQEDKRWKLVASDDEAFNTRKDPFWEQADNGELVTVLMKSEQKIDLYSNVKRGDSRQARAQFGKDSKQAGSQPGKEREAGPSRAGGSHKRKSHGDKAESASSQSGDEGSNMSFTSESTLSSRPGPKCSKLGPGKKGKQRLQKKEESEPTEDRGKGKSTQKAKDPDKSSKRLGNYDWLTDDEFQTLEDKFKGYEAEGKQSVQGASDMYSKVKGPGSRAARPKSFKESSISRKPQPSRREPKKRSSHKRTHSSSSISSAGNSSICDISSASASTCPFESTIYEDSPPPAKTKPDASEASGFPRRRRNLADIPAALGRAPDAEPSSFSSRVTGLSLAELCQQSEAPAATAQKSKQGSSLSGNTSDSLLTGLTIAPGSRAKTQQRRNITFAAEDGFSTPDSSSSSNDLEIQEEVLPENPIFPPGVVPPLFSTKIPKSHTQNRSIPLAPSSSASKPPAEKVSLPDEDLSDIHSILQQSEVSFQSSREPTLSLHPERSASSGLLPDMSAPAPLGAGRSPVGAGRSPVGAGRSPVGAGLSPVSAGRSASASAGLSVPSTSSIPDYCLSLPNFSHYTTQSGSGGISPGSLMSFQKAFVEKAPLTEAGSIPGISYPPGTALMQQPGAGGRQGDAESWSRYSTAPSTQGMSAQGGAREPPLTGLNLETFNLEMRQLLIDQSNRAASTARTASTPALTTQSSVGTLSHTSEGAQSLGSEALRFEQSVGSVDSGVGETFDPDSMLDTMSLNLNVPNLSDEELANILGTDGSAPEPQDYIEADFNQVDGLSDMLLDPLITEPHVATAMLDEELRQGVRLGDLAVVEKVLYLHDTVDVNQLDSNGTSLCMTAVSQGFTQGLEMLIKAECNVNLRNKSGHTALMIAAEQGNDVAVNLLLNGRAQVNTANNNHETAVMKAAKRGHYRVVQRLLSVGSNTATGSGEHDLGRYTRNYKQDRCADLAARHIESVLSVLRGCLTFAIPGVDFMKQLLPLQCLTPTESSTHKITFRHELEPTASGVGTLLFLGQTTVAELWSSCLLSGVSCVKSVSLNKTPLAPLTEGKFILTLAPLHNGRNEIVIETESVAERLLVVGYKCTIPAILNST